MGEEVLRLSPTSARDFKSCPQLFKFRALDRLPEPVSPAAARGSLVHVALQRLFGLAPEERTPAAADRLLVAAWRELRDDPEAGPDVGATDDWLAESRLLLGNLFKLEDPRALAVSHLEWWVEYELPEVQLRGVIDRVERHHDGTWTLTDYKTGRVPGERREQAAFFGLRFYALVCWRAFGVMPAAIRLVYLSDPAVLTLRPHERMLVAFERQMMALGGAIQRARERDDFRARPSPFCLSCPHQAICPAWAGAPRGAPADGAH